MRTQLLVSFGVLVVLVFACFIGIWASAVFSLQVGTARPRARARQGARSAACARCSSADVDCSLQATLIDSSKRYLTEQIGLIGVRITSEVNDVFDAKMKMAASSFLYPAAFGLYDTFGSTSVLEPLPTHAGSQVEGCSNPLMCLRKPIAFDDRDSDNLLGSFRCAEPAQSDDAVFKTLCSDWDGVSVRFAKVSWPFHQRCKHSYIS